MNQVLATEIALPAYGGLTDAEIAATLNAPVNGQTAIVVLASKDDVVELAQDVTFGAVQSTDAAIQQKWFQLLPILTTLLAATSDGVSQASVATSVNAAVADNLITRDRADAPWVKLNASRAEVLFNAGAIVTEQQVGEARNGQ